MSEFRCPRCTKLLLSEVEPGTACVAGCPRCRALWRVRVSGSGAGTWECVREPRSGFRQPWETANPCRNAL